MAELNEIAKDGDKNPNSKSYYISTTALQIDERAMQRFVKKKKLSGRLTARKRPIGGLIISGNEPPTD